MKEVKGVWVGVDGVTGVRVRVKEATGLRVGVRVEVIPSRQ